MRVFVALAAALLVAGAVPGAAAAEPECRNGYVALTFDDGPSTFYTGRFLDVLAARNAKATFFVNGTRFDGNATASALLRRMAADGHVVANHTYGHGFLTRMSDGAIRSTVRRNVDAAARIGVHMAPLVRPPFGAHSHRTDHVITEMGMTVVMWNIDPQDWRGWSSAYITRHVLSRLRPGGNVVMHDGVGASGNTLRALPGLIDGMRARGYCPGVLDDAGRVVPGRRPVPPDPGPDCPDTGECDSIGFVDAGGAWHLMDSVGSDAAVRTIWFGDPGDVPLMGDWDCDGVDTPATYRPSAGFVFLRNSNRSGIADRAFYFGDPGDVPLAGDWDGDGCDTLAVYRPADARMYLSNRLGRGPAEIVYTFGNPEDTPVVGDFNGDGRDDLGLHRSSTGLFYARFSHRRGVADLTFTFGDPGDVLVAGDWDGDGVDSLAAYRARSWLWYVKLENAAGPADHVLAGPDAWRIRPITGTFASR